MIVVLIIGFAGFAVGVSWGGKRPRIDKRDKDESEIVWSSPAPEEEAPPVPVRRPVRPEPQPQPDKPEPLKPEPAPAPAPKKPEPPKEKRSTDALASNTGAIMFICNDASHGDREAVIRFCPVCAKRDRFLYDYETHNFRCNVCNSQMKDYRCDECGNPPAPRRRIHLKKVSRIMETLPVF
jgi:hypothetical protein